MLAMAQALGDLDIQGVKLHLLHVIQGTPLACLYQQGTYQCLTQEEYLDIVCEFLALLLPMGKGWKGTWKKRRNF